MGTNSGAMVAHLADDEAVNRSRNAVTKMNPTMSSGPPSPTAWSALAPETATIAARLDQANQFTNWAAKNASTMYVPMPAMASPIMRATSRSLRMRPETQPNASPGTANNSITSMTMLWNSGSYASSPLRSGSRSGAHGASASTANTTRQPSVASSAARRAWRSRGSGASARAASPFQDPSRGSTIASVTHVPTAVSTNVEANRKYQLPRMPTV